jgi:hypothetical protein
MQQLRRQQSQCLQNAQLAAAEEARLTWKLSWLHTFHEYGQQHLEHKNTRQRHVDHVENLRRSKRKANEPTG